MKLAELRNLLNRKCGNIQEWHCGPAEIFVCGRDPDPRFDRKMEIYFEAQPARIDMDKIKKLLILLDDIGNRYNVLT